MRLTRHSACVTVLFVVGCGDPAVLAPDLPEGCAAPRACQVTGVDLVVEPPVLLLTAGHPRDAVTGRAILMPGEPFSWEVNVWNRGDARSTAVRLDSYHPGMALPDAVALPPLDPGELFTDTLVADAPSSFRLRRDTMWLTASISDRHPTEDPLYGNDRSHSEVFMVALPVIRATLAFPDTAREGEPLIASVTIRNLSRLAAFEPAAMAFCLFDYDVGCGVGGIGSPFGVTAVPGIDAGASWTTEITVTISDHSPYSPWNWNLVACFADAGATLDTFRDYEARKCVSDGREIHVLDAESSAAGLSERSGGGGG